MTTVSQIIPIDQIGPNPQQPRKTFEDAALHDLVDSIKEHGIIQPLIVCENTDTHTPPYYLIAGERRLRAATLANLTEVPCIVRYEYHTEQTRLELALIENIQRADLTPGEEAQAYAELHDKFGLSDEQIAQRVGKSRSDITTTRNLTKLPAAVIDRIGDGDGQLPKRVIRQLIPLATAVKSDELVTITDKIVALKPDGDQTPDDIIFTSLEDNADRLPHKGDGWDLNWPGKPFEYTPTEGGAPIAIQACIGCPSMVKAKSGWRGGEYCTNAACFQAKTQAYTDKELARVAKKTGIPMSGDGETIYTVPLTWNNMAQARKWLQAPPAHLRITAFSAAVDGGKLDAYQHKELLGSPVVVLGSLLKEPFKSKAEEVIVAADGEVKPETDAQRQKRIAAEEKQARANRAERGSMRRARADVLWLALNTAKIVAKQITISGPLLEFVAWFVDDRARSNGMWPGIATALRENEDAIAAAKGGEREALLRERIVLKMLYEEVPSYGNDWELNIDEVLARIETVITTRADASEECALGLKLPAGWNKPPIHKTPSNCWHCGRFTPNAEMTQVDRADGWGSSSHGSGKDGVTLDDVYCPDCGKELREKVQAEYMARGNKPIGKYTAKPVAKKPTTKKTSRGKK